MCYICSRYNYLCTYKFYGPMHNFFRRIIFITRGIGPWNSRLFWGPWNRTSRWASVIWSPKKSRKTLSFCLLEEKPFVLLAGGKPFRFACWRKTLSFCLLQGNTFHSACWRKSLSFCLLEENPFILLAAGKRIIDLSHIPTYVLYSSCSRSRNPHYSYKKPPA